MGKPWAKTEIDFINHPKFRALNANAICLWVEGKNYCDKEMTDGLIPAHIVKQFRFGGKKAVGLLTVSAGHKTESEAYAPLWETHPVGFKMHDYLDYNDCREEVLARLEQAEESRAVERDRLKRWRDAKKTKRETAVETVDETPYETAVKRAANGNETLYTETATATTELPKNGNSGRSAETHDVSAVILTFPTDGTPPEWPLTEQQVADWSTLYPSIDVLAECRKARAWIDADPKRRKTAGGMRRFLVNWLNNATNRPHAVSGHAGSRTAGNAAALQRFAARGVAHD